MDGHARVHHRADLHIECPSLASSFSSMTSVDPSTPGSYYHRRPSTGSAHSWEPALSGHSSVISPLSGPSTPKREEAVSPVDLFMADSRNYFTSVMPDMMPNVREFGNPILPGNGHDGFMHGAFPKELIDRSFQEFDMHTYQQPSPLFHDFQTNDLRLETADGFELSEFHAERPQPNFDFSSPMTTTMFTSPLHERPPSTVAPAQTYPPQPSTPVSSGANMALSWSYYSHSTSESPESVIGGYNSCITPSPDHSPSQRASFRLARANRQFPMTPQTPSRAYRVAKTRFSKSRRQTDEEAMRVKYPEIVSEHDKPNKCDFPRCNKRFKRQEHLKRHRKTHTPERPYECQFCEKKFSRTDNLKAHYVSHSKPGGRNKFVEDISIEEEMKKSFGPPLHSHS